MINAFIFKSIKLALFIHLLEAIMYTIGKNYQNSPNSTIAPWETWCLRDKIRVFMWCTQIYIHVHTHRHIFVHVCNMFTHTCTHMHTLAYVHSHTHTCSHTNAHRINSGCHGPPDFDQPPSTHPWIKVWVVGYGKGTDCHPSPNPHFPLSPHRLWPWPFCKMNLSALSLAQAHKVSLSE